MKAKAAQLADEAWGQYTSDALDLLAPTQVATARKVGTGNDPAPTGGTKQPDDKPKEPLPQLRAALSRVYRGGPDEAALALASRIRERRKAPDGDDDEGKE